MQGLEGGSVGQRESFVKNGGIYFVLTRELGLRHSTCSRAWCCPASTAAWRSSSTRYSYTA